MKNYRITELAHHFGLSRSTLLYYDRIGLLRPSGRTEANYRRYTQEDLARLERVCFFREAGLGLAEICLLLDKASADSSILEKRLGEIGREIARLKAQQRVLAGMLRKVTAGGDGSGLDKELWLSLLSACHFDEAALKRWHIEFERRAPVAHHAFLLSLGLSEKEALQVRMLTKNIKENTVAMKYFYQLFEDLPRQGPGCREATLKALGLLADLPAQPTVLDIGSGCGMQTLLLARQLRTKILAIDNHRPMLDRLDKAATAEGLDIETVEMSMMDMTFDKDSFDLLWSEGSIFIIGLARGLKEFRTYLKPGGYLAFTELCWLTDDRPAEAKAFFDKVYPDIRSTSEVCLLAAKEGYKVVETFNLPDSAWWDDYYTPMLARMVELQVKNAGIPEAEAVYAECQTEAEMFRKHSKSYGYTFFVLQRN
ncbi:MAG: MerR family transcriptional regulator [Desulforhopalus sp.]|nr:MerR family transcriptional regulator [Desulforhopalus sp.]